MKKLINLKKKVLYKSSYRGCKELDITIGSFIESRINELTIEQLEFIDNILDMDEQFLYDILIKKVQPEHEEDKATAKQILSIFNQSPS